MSDPGPEVFAVADPHEGWEAAAYAFDQSRDPNVRADYAERYHANHGRLLANLDVTLDTDGTLGGTVHFVVADFATSMEDPKLRELLDDALDVVRESEHQAAYVEVEHYEDGFTLFGRVPGLDPESIRQRLAEADHEGGMGLEEFLAWAETLDDAQTSN